jgi:hypothetical protein
MESLAAIGKVSMSRFDVVVLRRSRYVAVEVAVVRDNPVDGTTGGIFKKSRVDFVSVKTDWTLSIFENDVFTENILSAILKTNQK